MIGMLLTDRYTVIETINGKKQEARIMSNEELQLYIEILAKQHDGRYQLMQEKKDNWYRVEFGSKKNFLRYQQVK